ncbi:hypothetical protein RU97_GL001162 [Enterococcus canis]|uniref:HTH cro/C1-type domain-containing protein n=1 Tax=Enterococcus canis TaxID=214095 RepID=A0A1L8RII1_9ENTE|nr:helix-turn-helix transcriptional regulator [Enterococcus canis]OJG19591.1 hypothetical protein RU97_GL001162 [Enterococcus canis]
MNIAVFIEARKKLNLSQNELAQGICTQATLSRFENNGQVPSLKILLQLCERLNLSIGEIFPKRQDDELIQALDQAEFYLITMEVEKMRQLLATIDDTKIQAEPTLAKQYAYLSGFLAISLEQEIADSLFWFNQILLENEPVADDIFSLLAFCGMGLAYQQIQDVKKADVYFDKVLQAVTRYPASSTHDIWRVLNILYHTGVFYSQTGEFQAADALLHYGISLCSEHHVTYYVARIQFQLAQNARIQQAEPAKVQELLQDAAAFARLNQNQVLLAQIKAYQEG